MPGGGPSIALDGAANPPRRSRAHHDKAVSSPSDFVRSPNTTYTARQTGDTLVPVMLAAAAGQSALQYLLAYASDFGFAPASVAAHAEQLWQRDTSGVTGLTTPYWFHTDLGWEWLLCMHRHWARQRAVLRARRHLPARGAAMIRLDRIRKIRSAKREDWA